MRDFTQLDALVHAPIRLAALSLLAGLEQAEFTYLRDRIGTTDGNLSVHLSKLEQAGYIKVAKRFEDRKPRSFYCLTSTGRTAFETYVRHMRALIMKNP